MQGGVGVGAEGWGRHGLARGVCAARLHLPHLHHHHLAPFHLAHTSRAVCLGGLAAALQRAHEPELFDWKRRFLDCSVADRAGGAHSTGVRGWLRYGTAVQ